MKDNFLKSDKLPQHVRTIRSFVLRQGHMTAAQQRAIDSQWSKFGIDYSQETIHLDSVFQRNAPKILEIGFGMGVATATIAQNLPDSDFLAIDVHGPGVGNLLKLIDEEKITNIRVMRHDAVEVVNYMLANNSLNGIHIFFPDPWQKKRHHKRRLIKKTFIENLLPKLKTNGYIHLATDWEDYAFQMLDVLNHCDELKNTTDNFAIKPAYRPETKFETRGKRLGHNVWDLIFVKK